MFRNLRLPAAILTFLAIAASVRAGGFLYYTGFETNPAPPATSFPVGDDVFYTAPTPENWAASSAHSGMKLHSIVPESKHSQTGLGNVVELGGYTTSTGALFTYSATSSQTVRVSKTFGFDPVTSNQEIVTLSVLLGISDSTSSGVGTVRRDNFEFAFYNQTGSLIGFIQFDNNTLDTTTLPLEPARKIWRSNYQTSPLPAGLKAVDTGDTFYYDTIMHLVVRINFRTNRWTALLDDVALFSDVAFYTGTLAKNLGTVAAQMQVMNTVGIAPQQRAPGDNYMLFDDFLLRADPLPEAEIYDFARNSAGSVSFSWLTEGYYRYQVQYTDNPATPWLNNLPGSLSTATTSGTAPVFTDASAAGSASRFYRIKRMYP